MACRALGELWARASARAQELDLCDTGLGAAGCGALGRALGGMRRLKKLDLGCVEGAICGLRRARVEA